MTRAALAWCIVVGATGVFVGTVATANAQSTPQVEQPAELNLLELLKTPEGREVLLAKLEALREAAMLLPPAPNAEAEKKQQEVLHEVQALEGLLQQYQQVAPSYKKKR